MPKRRLLDEQQRLLDELDTKKREIGNNDLLQPLSDPEFSDLTNRLAAIARELEELSKD